MKGEFTIANPLPLPSCNDAADALSDFACGVVWWPSKWPAGRGGYLCNLPAFNDYGTSL
jgi:hypothetical protein